jgi:hypothetical protein
MALCKYHRWISTQSGTSEETCDIDPLLVEINLFCDEGTWCPYYKPKEGA